MSTGVAQCGCDPTCVSHDVGVHRPITKCHAQRDPHTFDAGRFARNLWWITKGHNVAPVRPGDYVLEQRAVGHRARQRPVVAVLVEVIRRQSGHAAERWLEPDHTGERRRDANRSADVAAGGKGRESGRQPGRRPARRTARSELDVPWIARHPPQLAVAEAGATEFGRRRADVDDAAGALDAFDDRVVVLGDLISEGERPLLPRPPHHGLFLLGRHAQAFEWSRCVSLSRISKRCFLRLGASLVIAAVDDCVDARVVGLDSVDQRLDVFHGRKLAAAKQLERLMGGLVVQIRHRASIAALLGAIVPSPVQATTSSSACMPLW